MAVARGPAGAAPALEPAPKTRWTSGPRLHKEGTDFWKLQGVAHWEGDQSQANRFLEQDITIAYTLREKAPDGSLRVAGSGTLHALEVFPLTAAGSTSRLETNDIHDYAISLKGSCAGEVTVRGRLTLGRLYCRKADGSRGERVTSGGHAQDFRYHYLEGTFTMNGHAKEPGFEFEADSESSRYSYTIPWDERAALKHGGDSPDRVPPDGVKEE